MGKRIRVLEKLTSFQELTEDWDSYGALPIHPKAIGLATWMILASIQYFGWDCPYSADAFPVPDGGVQLEWEGALETLEIHILPDGKVNLLLVSGRENGKDRQYEEAHTVSLEEVLLAVERVLYPGVRVS